jgi:hypothetical protein
MIIDDEFRVASQDEWIRARMSRSVNSIVGRLLLAFILLGVGIAIGVLYSGVSQ